MSAYSEAQQYFVDSHGSAIIKYLPLVIAALTAGCATSPAPDVENVRIVTQDAANALKCKHLLQVNSAKSASQGGMPAAHLDARNQVAKAGGNALVLKSQVNTQQGGGEIAGDGYSCASF